MLLATGYLKPVHVVSRMEAARTDTLPLYTLRLTNLEVFSQRIFGWNTHFIILLKDLIYAVVIKEEQERGATVYT